MASGCGQYEDFDVAVVHKLWATERARQVVKVEAAKAGVTMVQWVDWAVAQAALRAPAQAEILAELARVDSGHGNAG